MITDQKTSKTIVGAYLLEGTIEGAKLGLSTKPPATVRFFAKKFLGWGWASIKELKNYDNK